MRQIRFVEKTGRHYAVVLPFGDKEGAERALKQVNYAGYVVEIVE